MTATSQESSGSGIASAPAMPNRKPATGGGQVGGVLRGIYLESVDRGGDAALQQRARESRLAAAELHHPRALHGDDFVEEIGLVGDEASR